MPPARQDHSANRKTRMGECGQATVEFALGALPLMLILAFTLIDFSREIFQQQVIVGLTRDGSSMAARATTLSDAANTVIQGTSPLNLNTYGRIIITPVINNGTASNPVYQVAAAQYAAGSCQGCASTASKIAPSGAVGSAATLPPLPPGGLAFPQPGKTIYATEIYYAFQPLTPIGKLLAGLVWPTQLYDVAYI